MPESLPRLRRQMCTRMCYTSRSAPRFSSFCSCFRTHLQFRNMLACCFMPTDSKMSGDDKNCFPIHSCSPRAGTALERHHISLSAFLPISTRQQDEASHAFPEGLTFARLSSAAHGRHSCHPLPFMADWKGATVQQVSLHHTLPLHCTE